MTVQAPLPNATQGLNLTDRQLAMLKVMGIQHVWPTPPSPQIEGSVPQVTAMEDVLAAAETNACLPSAEAHQPSTSLDALTLAVSACQRCPLGQQRAWATLGEGQVGSSWMFVLGSAPVVNGTDFVLLKQPAQQLLLAMTRALGLSPQAHWVTTLSKCASPSMAVPTVEDMRACVPHLRDQIECVQPQVLVIMGTGAAQAMGLAQPQQPLGQLRQQRHEFAGIPAVVTYPPEFLLRHPQDKARAWEDLCLAASWIDPPTMQP